MTSLNPNWIPFYGYISRYLANAFIIPGAPWQKWTSLTLCLLFDVAKFPFIKCLSKNKIEGWITFKNLLMYSCEKWFIFIDISITLRLPPSPCAPPKYYFWWKVNTSLKSSANLYLLSSKLTLFFVTCSYS